MKRANYFVYITITMMLILGLVFKFTACGGGGSDGTSSGGNGGTSPEFYDAGEVADEVTKSMGEDDGLSAVILAIDRGYSLRQIAAAATSGRLASDGLIDDGKGGQEDPLDPPVNLINGAVSTGMLVASTKFSLSQMKEGCKKLAQANPIVFILSMLDMGYTPEQTFQAIFFGEVEFHQIGSKESVAFEMYIIDEGGNRVAPPNPPRGICSELMVKIDGPTSLELKNGEAAGTWQLTLTRGTCKDQTFYLYVWDDGSHTENQTGEMTSHTYSKAGTYQVRGTFLCDSSQEGLKGQAWSNTLLVEVKEEKTQAACPEGTWSVKWMDQCDERLFFYGSMDIGPGNSWSNVSGVSCETDGSSTWSLNGNQITLNGTYPGSNNCYAVGTVVDKEGTCSEIIQGKEYIVFTEPFPFTIENCWEANRIPLTFSGSSKSTGK